MKTSNKKIVAIVIACLLLNSAFADNESYSSSTGNHNDVKVSQTDSDLSSSIVQVGDRNEAETIQSAEGNTTAVNQSGNDNDSKAFQSGKSNLATVDQIRLHDSANNNVSEIIQTGNENDAKVNQGNWDYSYINQLGGNNTAIVEQTGFLGDGHNKSSITQGGDGNKAIVTQPSAYNAATLNQEGNDNIAEVTQNGSRNHIATVNQKGDDNLAEVTQNGLRNTTTLNQDDGNSATVLQDGMGVFTGENTVLINQYNRSNIAVAKQHGDIANSITINQEGKSYGGSSTVNSTTAIQDGSFNTTTISQQP